MSALTAIGEFGTALTPTLSPRERGRACAAPLAATSGQAGQEADQFLDILKGAAASGQPGQVREAVTQLISTALVEPALASMRESPFLTGPFAPGDAERRFGPLLDQRIADKVVTAAKFPVIDMLVERYTRQAHPAFPATAAPHGAPGSAAKEHVDAAA